MCNAYAALPGCVQNRSHTCIHGDTRANERTAAKRSTKTIPYGRSSLHSRRERFCFPLVLVDDILKGGPGEPPSQKYVYINFEPCVPMRKPSYCGSLFHRPYVSLVAIKEHAPGRPTLSGRSHQLSRNVIRLLLLVSPACSCFLFRFSLIFFYFSFCSDVDG